MHRDASVLVRKNIVSPISECRYHNALVVFRLSLAFSLIQVSMSLLRHATFPLARATKRHGWPTRYRLPHRQRYKTTLSDCKWSMDNPGTLQSAHGLLANWLRTIVCGRHAKEHSYRYLNNKRARPSYVSNRSCLWHCDNVGRVSKDYSFYTTPVQFTSTTARWN